ncbi:unnamed protein product [Didymodactylos carnosus]|uniref:Copper transport protein n=1 Tax=Didymodactylos carnosus TaxID=1234261 RepID=A0A814BQQ5_9BILA|nr:unnamed protein product [Didymodactylos carnosus]CAF0930119.1 unnamed protein product [Didymodactylos carnosus]CAF3584631.1 unnamed protein product [Didymodactylos carnosus]CAF3708175.1 unnamed protein product [Didymodactylos carnosus]
MTFTFNYLQNDFMLKNLNISTIGDCLGAIFSCVAFALLLELSKAIELYLRHYPKRHPQELILTNVLPSTIYRKRIILHAIQSFVHLLQVALSYVLMLMLMNDFAGFLISASIGIGYYLMNGVHPYTVKFLDNIPFIDQSASETTSYLNVGT